MIFMMAPLSCSLITGCQRCVNHEWTRIDTNLMGQTADHTALGSAPVPGAGDSESFRESRTFLNQSTSSRGRNSAHAGRDARSTIAQGKLYAPQSHHPRNPRVIP